MKGLTKTPTGTVIADTPEAIQFVQLCSMKGRLNLEISGIRFRLPTVPAVNRLLGTNYRSRQRALEAVQAEIDKRTAEITEDPA